LSQDEDEKDERIARNRAVLAAQMAAAVLAAKEEAAYKAQAEIDHFHAAFPDDPSGEAQRRKHGDIGQL